MKRIGIIGLGFALAMSMVGCGGGGGGSGSTTPTPPPVSTEFTVSSLVVAEGGTLPLEHASAKYDGGMDLVPSFYWKNAPKDTGSYVLYIERTDEKNQSPAYIAVNIPATVNATVTGVDIKTLGANAFNVTRDCGCENGYIAPARMLKYPPIQPEMHYKVTILAMSKSFPVVKEGDVAWLNLDVPNHWGQSFVKDYGTYVIGRASMTYKY